LTNDISPTQLIKLQSKRRILLLRNGQWSSGCCNESEIEMSLKELLELVNRVGNGARVCGRSVSAGREKVITNMEVTCTFKVGTCKPA